MRPTQYQYPSGLSCILLMVLVLAVSDVICSETDSRSTSNGQPPSDHSEQSFSIPPGLVVDLDNALFSQKLATFGHYAPLRFLYEIGGNIYFIKQYSPHKTPILFIHGAKGSPRDFRLFAREAETKGYQAWFWHWGTGGEIGPQAALLHKKLKELYQMYQFKKLHIAAHSLGGLLARCFIVNKGGYHPYIDTFTSIATPWGGVGMAYWGAKHSPVVLPVWKDISPGSIFLKSLYVLEMPASIEYLLFYAYLDGSLPEYERTDGAIPVTSQLDPRARAGAKRILGFQASHEEVLSRKAMFKNYFQMIR